MRLCIISKRGNQGQGGKREGGNRNNVLNSGVSDCPLVSEEIWPLLAKRIASEEQRPYQVDCSQIGRGYSLKFQLWSKNLLKHIIPRKSMNDGNMILTSVISIV